MFVILQDPTALMPEPQKHSIQLTVPAFMYTE